MTKWLLVAFLLLFLSMPSARADELKLRDVTMLTAGVVSLTLVGVLIYQAIAGSDEDDKPAPPKKQPEEEPQPVAMQCQTQLALSSVNAKASQRPRAYCRMNG